MRVSDAIITRDTMSRAIVIGIDPGIASTGIAIVEGKGFRVDRHQWDVIRTLPSLPQGERLNTIHRAILQRLQHLRPNLVVIEDVFLLDAAPKSAFAISTVIGVVLLAAAQSHVPIELISVREAKQVLTGNGRASKEQLERTVRSILGIDHPIKPDHASDALGLALIGLLRYDTRS